MLQLALSRGKSGCQLIRFCTQLLDLPVSRRKEPTSWEGSMVVVIPDSSSTRDPCVNAIAQSEPDLYSDLNDLQPLRQRDDHLFAL